MTKEKNKSYMREILKFYKKHIGFYLGFIIILIIKAIISFMSAKYIADIITSMMSSNFEGAFYYATINISLLVVYNLIGYLNTYFYKNLENRVRFDIQQAVVSSALNIRMSYYDTMGSGVIVTRITSDIDHLSERFKTLSESIVNVFRRISYLVYIFILSWIIGLFVLVSVSLVTIIYAIRTHYLKKMKPAVKQQAEVVSSRIIEIVRAVKDIKTLNCDNNALSLLEKDQKEYIKRDNKEWYVGIGFCRLTDLMINIFEYLFIVFSIFLLLNNGIEIAIFYTCYLYKDHTFLLANEMGDFRYKFAECQVIAQRIYFILHPDRNDIDTFGDEYIENYDGGVEFKDVNFSYSNGVRILEKISLKIEPRTTVALVGESGSGKSTIANLISHLYYKSSGQILFKGQDIDLLSKDFIKNNIAVVNQFPYIFNLSIRQNFQMINKDITDNEIWDLCNLVGLKNFILSIPNGLDSVIGEGGCQLSGGQRQKLCIARALSRNVKILIFDEATSSLDNSSQDEIMEVIENLKSSITIILIAHRLSTIVSCDKIFLLKNGKIESQGTHNELIETCNYYKTLYFKEE